MPQRSEYDAVVIGAGLVGLASAWRAAERGLSVLVLERDGPAAGASSAAAGMLAPVTEAEFGAESLLRLNLAGRELWPRFAAPRRGAPPAARGALVVAADRDDAEELRRLHAFHARSGSTRSGWRHATAGGSSPASRRAAPAASWRRGQARSTRARRRSRLRGASPRSWFE